MAAKYNQVNSKLFLYPTGFPSSLTLFNLYLPLLTLPSAEATKHLLSAFLALDTSKQVVMN
jgi:hypothetical protein